MMKSANRTSKPELGWLDGRRVLITGAAGFIGSHLSRVLDGSRAEVHIVSRAMQPKVKGNARCWTVDLSDMAATKRMLQNLRPDILFHLAGAVAGGRDIALVLPTFQSNLLTTVNILLCAGEIGIARVVLPSSLEEPDDPMDIPSSPYTASKWAAREYALMFNALYQTPVAVGRVSVTYGPTSKDLQKLIPYVILCLLKGEAPRLGSGQREVDWIYVDDVVEGLLTLARVDNALGKALHIGSGKLVSIRDVVLRLVELINPSIEPQFGEVPQRALEKARYSAANVEQTFSAVGWRPQVSLDEGLQMTVNWFASHATEKRDVKS